MELVSFTAHALIHRKGQLEHETAAVVELVSLTAHVLIHREGQLEHETTAVVELVSSDAKKNVFLLRVFFLLKKRFFYFI